MSPRHLVAAAALALVASCSTGPANDGRRPVPPASNDAPVGGGVVGASGVTFGEQAAPPPPTASGAVDAERIEPDNGQVTVEGRLERPIAPPDGDPRNAVERRRDQRAWDRCILRAQREDTGPGTGISPITSTPEELCARSLGMASRESVPDSRR